MRTPLLWALYGGPDQLMPITSGLTAIFAFVLIFWNKVLVTAGKFLNLFRHSSQSAPAASTEPLKREPADGSES
jgi:hypothetical protein